MRTKVTAQEFVESYLRNGKDLRGVSEELDVTLATVKNTLKRLRKAGVKLPLPPKPRTPNFDVASLNTLIKSYKRN